MVHFVLTGVTSELVRQGEYRYQVPFIVSRCILHRVDGMVCTALWSEQYYGTDSTLPQFQLSGNARFFFSPQLQLCVSWPVVERD